MSVLIFNELTTFSLFQLLPLYTAALFLCFRYAALRLALSCAPVRMHSTDISISVNTFLNNFKSFFRSMLLKENEFFA